jgi:hypothetical protein
VTETSARTRRRKVAREAFRSAAEAIGPIEPGMGLFLLTRGQFSMLDIVKHVVEEIRPARVSVWTWAIAAEDFDGMHGLLANAAIVGARPVEQTE